MDLARRPPAGRRRRGAVARHPGAARPPTHPPARFGLPAAPPADSAVPAALVERLLSGIACTDDDPADSEAWVAPDGRFRLAALVGAWAKPAAVYIGHAARAAARKQRLADVAGRLTQIADELIAVQAMDAQLTRDQDQAADEWHLVPSEEALRNAHLSAAASAREAQTARQQLSEA